MPSGTYTGFALLRSNPKKRPRCRHRQSRGLRQVASSSIRFREREDPPPTKSVDAIDNLVFDSTIPYDLRFFESLDRMVQTEPWLERDKAMIDQLKSIGIEKGKPFNPDAKTQADPQRRRARSA